MPETIGQRRIVLLAVGIVDHRDGGQQLEAGLPDIEARQMALERRLGILCATVKLGQRQRPPRDQAFIRVNFTAHEQSPTPPVRSKFAASL